MGQITALVQMIHDYSVEKGWTKNDGSDQRSFPEVVALMHSELSEAIEDYRNGHLENEIFYEGSKPCGIPIELADCIIRIFQRCGSTGIDIEAAILEKMNYNNSRPFRHGGKKI